MRMLLIGVVVAAGCANDDLKVEVFVSAEAVHIDVEHEVNYFPLVEEGCDDPGDSYDSALGEPDCAVKYQLRTDDGELTATSRGGYTFLRSGLGGTLEMDGCGVHAMFPLPDTLPIVTNPVATRDGSTVIIHFESPPDAATHFSASRQNGSFGYLTCTVRGDEREISMSTTGSASPARIDLVALDHHEVGGVVIEARSEPLRIMQPTE